MTKQKKGEPYGTNTVRDPFRLNDYIIWQKYKGVNAW